MEYVRKHLPWLEGSPGIVETCIYTVSANRVCAWQDGEVCMYVLVRGEVFVCEGVGGRGVCVCVCVYIYVCFGEGNVCVLQLQCFGGGVVYVLKRE